MSFFGKTTPTTINPPIDTSLDIDQRVSARAKRLSLKVNFATGRIELVIPKRTPKYLIERFLVSNKGWVAEKQKELPQKIPFENNAVVPLFGRDTTILINMNTDIKRTKAALNDSTLDIETNLDDPSQRIQRYLKKQALERYDELATPKAAHISREIEHISIRDTKSRWGSCSQDGRISLSWRLIFAPYEAMDYVIAHEVAHLKHMDHSPAFWKTCEELCLDYKTGKSWMKDNGHTLMRYGR